MQKYGLGKGLSALISERSPREQHQDESVVNVLSIHQIIPSILQPRLNFNNETLRELVDSIKSNGVIQPINKEFQILLPSRSGRVYHIPPPVLAASNE